MQQKFDLAFYASVPSVSSLVHHILVRYLKNVSRERPLIWNKCTDVLGLKHKL